MALKSKEFPSQTENRRQWILDVVSQNQQEAGWILVHLGNGVPDAAKEILDGMYKSDRDALLQPDGVLMNDQIELLK